MSITELVSLGYSRKSLNNWVHAKGFPAHRTSEKGQWRIDTTKLDAWLVRKGLKKKDSM